MKALFSPRSTTPRGGTMPLTNECDLTGWLHKRGENNPSFKRRFFMLKGKTLSYHVCESDEA